MRNYVYNSIFNKAFLLVILLVIIISPISLANRCNAEDVTLKQDVNGYTGCKDTYLDSAQPTINFGDNCCDQIRGNPRRHFIISFDLPPEIINAHIVSARIVFYCWYVDGWVDGQSLKLYRLTQDWDEGSATWNQRMSGIPWATAGGTFEATLLDSSPIPNSSYYPEFDITNLVQQWANQTQGNYGVILVNDTVMETGIKTSEYSEYGRPYLEITYSPAGATYYLDSDGDGYGDPYHSTQIFPPPQGYVDNSGDCDDTNPHINPGATEVDDGVDNDCDGLIDECVPPQQGMIIDHTCTDISQVSPGYVTAAKNIFRVWYGHTSHGSQITSGMGVLAAQNSLYRYNSGPGSLSYYETGGDLGGYGDLTWRDATIAQLNQSGNDRNLVMWSWCGGVSDNTQQGIDTYLQAMDQLESAYPQVTFIYMTGHLDGSGEFGNLNIRNNQIRDYCRTHGKVLFDFADIESYDPDAHYFLDRGADDACNYDGGSRNWALEWCSYHSDQCPYCDCAHSQSLNCNLKGRAFWWMLARLAGWTPDCSPATEICDGLDNDCDGQVDEGCCVTYYRDTDGDSYGFDGDTRCLNAPDAPYTTIQGGDCDDNDSQVNPGATEVCDDGIDNNCNGEIDIDGGCGGCTWQAMIRATGQQAGNAVRVSNVTIGMSSNPHTLPAPGAPPEYTVWMRIRNAALNSYYAVDIRSNLSDREYWILRVQVNDDFADPGAPGYYPILSWNPAEFCSDPDTDYSLYLGNQGTGTCLVSDMRETTSYQIQPGEGEYFSIVYSNELCVDLPLNQGWNLISIPVLPNNPTAANLFPGAVVIYEFDPSSGYIALGPDSALEVGRGYWVNVSEARTYQICGQEVPSHSEDLGQGWSLIGGISYLCNIQSTPGEIVVLYSFDPLSGYIPLGPALNLVPGLGYWINLTQPSTITMEYTD